MICLSRVAQRVSDVGNGKLDLISKFLLSIVQGDFMIEKNMKQC